ILLLLIILEATIFSKTVGLLQSSTHLLAPPQYIEQYSSIYTCQRLKNITKTCIIGS
ncbi:hypothetical protein ACJX0J_032570, partial [Zea mays]